MSFDLEPPPSILELVKDNPTADYQWKTWLDRLSRYSDENHLRLDTTNGPLTGTLDLSAGTTSDPPITFTSGPLTTTPQQGAIEFSGGNWYISNEERYAIVRSSEVKTSTTTVVNSATETVVYSYDIVAGSLIAGERFVFEMVGAYSNASATDDFTIRFKIGGVTINTLSRVGGNVTNSGWKAAFEATMRTIGASGTYVEYAEFFDGTTNQSSASTTEYSVDTIATVTFEVTVQWDSAKAGNTFSCTQADLVFRH